MRAAAANQQGPQTFLAGQGLEADQLRMLTLAADLNRSAQASIVALQSGVAGARSQRTHIEDSAVTIIDTPEGRLVAEDVRSAGKTWMIIAPGATSNITAAISQMVRRLPAHQDWHSYRKVV
jgi:hypothetical protein